MKNQRLRSSVAKAIIVLFAFATPSVAADVRVIDGDTFALDGEKVRLKGISAPEMRESGGRASKDHLTALIGGRGVVCQFTGERTHDRQVGWCRAGDLDLNGQMVRDGWAAACPRYSTRYVEFEAEA